MAKRMTEKEKARFTQMFKHSAMKKAAEIDAEAKEVRETVHAATKKEAIKLLNLGKPMKATSDMHKKIGKLFKQLDEVSKPIDEEIAKLRARIRELHTTTNDHCDLAIQDLTKEHKLAPPHNWYNRGQDLDDWANYLTKMLTNKRPDPAQDLMDQKAKVLENATQFTDAVYLADSAEEAMDMLIGLAEMFEMELPPAMKLLLEQRKKKQQ